MTVYIAADHAGFSLKESLVSYLTELGHHVEDCGAFSYDESDDYPDIMKICAEKVAKDPTSRGIGIGASGQGEAIALNKVSGIRAAVFYGAGERTQKDASGKTLTMLESVRMHNDANVLSLGARFITEEEAKMAVVTFLETVFGGEERHVRRIAKL
jgi:ribose 5-phosphate isomerase B